MRISANGGTPETIVKTDNEMISSAQILPGGKSVLFTTFSASSRPLQVVVQSLKSGQRKELFAGVDARHVPTGHIVYASENNLFAIPFDLDRLEAVGGPVSVVEGVFKSGVLAHLQYAVSDSGTLVYMPLPWGSSAPRRTLVWVDRNGKEELLGAPTNAYSNPIISPDGTRVALSVGSIPNADFWIWDFVRKTMTSLTFDKAHGGAPLWTPDGKRIVFLSFREGSAGLNWKPADGTGKEEPLGSEKDRLFYPASWSKDGKTLVLIEIVGTGIEFGADIGMLSMEGDRKYKPLLRESYLESRPRISPNGRWMAYQSNESGHMEVYVRPYPEVDKGRWQVSTSGGDCPLWSPDGQELFYRNGEAYMAVSVKAKPAFSLETPRILFRGNYFSLAIDRPWDISPDGKRFLMIKPPVTAGGLSAGLGPRRINIVLNWFEELKQRVPVK